MLLQARIVRVPRPTLCAMPSSQGDSMARKPRRTSPDAPQAPLTETKVRSVARALQAILVELQGGASFQLTRLTRVKPLCADQAAARQFAVFIAGRALVRLQAKGQTQPSYASVEQWVTLMALAPEGVTRMEQYLASPTPELERMYRFA